MIERLYVQNFRCLEALTLDFKHKSSILLIGKNGVGKSTTRSALQKLQEICRGQSRVGRLILPTDFSFGRTDRPLRFELEVTIAGLRHLYSVAFDWPERFREARIIEESLTVDSVEIFGRKLSQVTMSSGPAFSLDWHVFALSVVSEKPPARSIDTMKRYLRELVLIAPIPGEMTGFSVRPDEELEASAANFASCLRGLLEQKPAAYAAFETSVREVISDFSSIDHEDRGKDGKQLHVTFQRPDAKELFRVEFDVLSDGEKCFFLGAFLVSAIKAGGDVVFFWDEPDGHLSIPEIGRFVTRLRKISRHGSQFIATSHHPETIRKFSDENTFVLTRESRLDPTRVQLLGDLQRDGELIEALILDEVIG